MKKWEDFEKLVSSVNTEEEFSELKSTTELIGKIIKARIAKGWTQTELAQRSGLKQPAIARLESQAAIPKIDTLIKITNALGLRLIFVDKSTEIDENPNPEVDAIKKEVQELKSVIQSLNEKFDLVLSGDKIGGKITKTKVTIEEQTIEPHNIIERLWWADTQTQTPSYNKLLNILLSYGSNVGEELGIKKQNRYSTSQHNRIIPFKERSVE